MKFLHQPIKPFTVFQKFGEDMVCINNKDSKDLIQKKTSETCPAGYRSIYPPIGHTGIDCPAYRWQPVYSSCDGFVEEICTEEARGLGVGVVTDKKYPCSETQKDEFFKVRYWHFIAIDVDKGQKVRTGTLLGYADSTGYSTGDHLHYELKPVAQNSRGLWYNVLQNNGGYGSINPEPYMTDSFALDINLIVKMLENISLMLSKLSDMVRGRIST